MPYQIREEEGRLGECLGESLEEPLGLGDPWGLGECLGESLWDLSGLGESLGECLGDPSGLGLIVKNVLKYDYISYMM